MQEQVLSLTRELKEKTKEYKEAYRKLKQEANGKVDYDSVVDTTTPVYKQYVPDFYSFIVCIIYIYILPICWNGVSHYKLLWFSLECQTSESVAQW